MRLTANDSDAIDSRARHVGEEASQVSLGIGTADRRRGGDEADVARIDAECEADAAQQERDFSGAGADVAVRFVQHDIAQPSLRFRQDRTVFWAKQHVLEHCHVGDEYRRRGFAKRAAVGNCLRPPPCVGAPHLVRQKAVIEGEPNAAVEWSRPVPQPLLLRGDERVQRVENDSLDAVVDRPAARLPHKVVDDRHEKAFRLA